MTKTHRAFLIAAIIGEVLLLLGILLGHHTELYPIIGVKRFLRDSCLAVWAVAVPAWFTLEAMLFAPDPTTEPVRAQAFARGQRAGLYATTVAGAIIFAALGLSAPEAQQVTVPPTQAPPTPSGT
ncbi:hypothetical protein [Novosphingobium sp. 9U]|uniref:hypothetical protein n=1 Tax=Novosphingobium sp. 9U TaxID=2653158 RepID=UPI0012F1B654|nr:hypothetical protein [Novosphingobium sp. 9U]VWX46624.1 membrane hypothetical protein [Novosphingobium sp. 9U]